MSASSEEYIRPDVDPASWFNQFQKGWLGCLIEVIKNAIDWQASFIKLEAVKGAAQISYLDDGRGMDATNRKAFLSVGRSTAGPDGAGVFGTGSKYMVFSFANHVRVETAPQDSPDSVFIMEFTPDELAEAYCGIGGGIRVRRVAKTAKSWPYEHPHGTKTTVALKDPRLPTLYRGESLAQKLSDRLDMTMASMVLVNDKPLPSKRYARGSRVFDAVIDASPAMGGVRFFFYRPLQRSTADDLLMTDRSIGEVKFRDSFCKDTLSDEQLDLVPALYLDNDVCGLISAGFLHGYVHESRDKYQAELVNDERVNLLLYLLRQYEAEVAERLGIKLKRSDDGDTQGREVIDQFVQKMRTRYNPKGESPSGWNEGDGEGEGGTTEPKTKPTATRKSHPELEASRPEFALGETIELKLKVPEKLKLAIEDFHFYTEQAKAKLISREGGRLTLQAEELGRGLVQAIHPKSGRSAKVEYDVVLERVFHLSAHGPIGLGAGSKFVLEALNTDKLKGDIVWELGGVGQIEPFAGGRKARFSSDQTGLARITAHDSAAKLADVCEINVLPVLRGEGLLKIRDKYFRVDYQSLENSSTYGKIATIIPVTRGEVNRLVVNCKAPAYEAALRGESLVEVFAQAVSHEFAKQFLVEVEDSGVDGTDYASIITQVQVQAEILFAEMLA